ncbi:hypothetical protein FOB20_02155 [Acinetobacter lwoffii]|uniref:hypothetical protein n=1 Tax=Acinetobacter lwoffii TaxID=28090 RepID=UPI0015833007|nr:hypothetical protein [Acinetobacter lwoffii]QKT97712.1 hypothetical protein FOB20_02155 [Acinetobacter lwoffii]
MGVKQIINDVDASDLGIGYSAVVSDGLQYLNFYGGSVSAGKNLVGENGTVIGTPVAKGMGLGLACTQANKISIQKTRGTKGTIIAVFNPNSAIRAYAVTDASVARPIGLSVYAEPTATTGLFDLVAQLGYANSAPSNQAVQITLANSMNVNVPNFVAVTFDASVSTSLAMTLKNLTKSTSSTGSSATVATHATGAVLNIGSLLDASVACSSNVLCVAYYDRVLTDIEIAKQYAQIKKYYKDVHNIDL